MSFIALAWRYKKYLGAALAVLCAAYAVWSYGNTRYEEGAARVQKQWAEDAEASRVAADKQRAETEAREREARARNEEVINAYQEQISDITADRVSLARRLRDNEIRIRAMSEAANKPGASDTIAQPASTRTADAALDAYDRACRADAAQLDALIRQVRGQLDSPSDAS